jgi:hypothetical protein
MKKIYCKNCQYREGEGPVMYCAYIIQEIKYNPYNGVKIQGEVRNSIDSNVEGECKYYEKKSIL